MIFSIATAIAVLATATSPPKWHQLSESYSFDDYMVHFKKTYITEEEKAKRKSIFEAELRDVLSHNSQEGKTWKKGINHLSDMTEQEVRSSMTGYKRHMSKPVTPENVYAPETISYDNDADIDWRKKGVVTPIKNQGSCGSCWTFATASSIESARALKGYPLQILSEQQILDCPAGSNPHNCGGTGGCKGGTVEHAVESIKTLGSLSTEWVYPYISYSGDAQECQKNRIGSIASVSVSGYKKIPANNYSLVMHAITNEGPLSISVDAGWRNYETGVFDGCNQTSPLIDHGVQLVGVGTDPKFGPYWTVRNSWSVGFGESGYIRLRRITDQSKQRCGWDTQPAVGTGCDGGPDKVKVCGTCGILFDTVLVQVD